MKPFYFYYLLPKGTDLSKGLLSPYAAAKFNKELALYMVNKYRNRLVDAWGYYPGRDPRSLTLDEIMNGLIRYRGESSTKEIYFFKFPPHKSLGKNMKDVLENKDIYRINLNNSDMWKYIDYVDWGHVNSNSDNKKLNRKYYEEITYSEYFSRYNDNPSKEIPLFASLHHIGIVFKNGYLPAKYIEYINHNRLDRYEILNNLFPKEKEIWGYPSERIDMMEDDSIIFERVLHDGDIPVAFVYCTASDKLGHTKGDINLSFAVHKDYRGKGYAKTVIKLALDFFKRSHYNTMSWIMDDRNKASYKLAEKFGFIYMQYIKNTNEHLFMITNPSKIKSYPIGENMHNDRLNCIKIAENILHNLLKKSSEDLKNSVYKNQGKQLQQAFVLHELNKYPLMMYNYNYTLKDSRNTDYDIARKIDDELYNLFKELNKQLNPKGLYIDWQGEIDEGIFFLTDNQEYISERFIFNEHDPLNKKVTYGASLNPKPTNNYKPSESRNDLEKYYEDPSKIYDPPKNFGNLDQISGLELRTFKGFRKLNDDIKMVFHSGSDYNCIGYIRCPETGIQITKKQLPEALGRIPRTDYYIQDSKGNGGKFELWFNPDRHYASEGVSVMESNNCIEQVSLNDIKARVRFVKGDQGTMNSVYKINGRDYRVRVETFIFRDLHGERCVFYQLKNNHPTSYGLMYKTPGGSIEPGKSFEEQASDECNEEARIKIKNVRYTGISYISEYKDKSPDWQRASVLSKHGVNYVGAITFVYVAEYDGIYNGFIAEVDKSNLWIKGEWWTLDEFSEICSDQHKPLLSMMGSVSEATETSLMRRNESKKMTRKVVYRHSTDHKYSKYSTPKPIVSQEEFTDWL